MHRSQWVKRSSGHSKLAYVGEDEENLGLVRVGDPHLGAVDDPVISILGGTRLESKGVGSGASFRETERAELRRIDRISKRR